MDIKPETVGEETKEDIAEEAQETRDPKRREVVEHEHELERRTQSEISLAVHLQVQKQPPKQQVLTADMNLSDSSSDEEGD
jgi:hypothetical protein